MTESEVRQWMKEIGVVVAKAATITTNDVDDKVVKMFFDALDNDWIWSLLWPIVDGLFEDDTKVMATADFDDACSTKMINPLTVIAIVRAIIALYNQFKKS
jgi:hypothetical protein